MNTLVTTDADDGDSMWSFTTVTSLDKVSPEDGTTEVNPRATLIWDAMPGATSYQYCVDTTDNNACNRWVSAGAAITVTLNGLKYATTYYWQVRAVTATGTTEADAGDWWTFTTRDSNAPPKNAPDFRQDQPCEWSDRSAHCQPGAGLGGCCQGGYYEYCIQDAPITDDDPCNNWDQGL